MMNPGDTQIAWGSRTFLFWLWFAIILPGPIHAGGVPNDRSDIETLRHALEARTRNEEPDQSVARIDLRGYNWHRRLDPSPSLAVVAVSYFLRGDLFLFDAGGSLLTRVETSELIWLQLFDFDQDGVDELITEEVDLRGTGVLIKSFHIYRISRAAIELLWEGISYSRKWLGQDPVTGESRVEFTRGYLRGEPGGYGRSARLLHLRDTLESGGEPRIIREGYELTEEGFRSVSW